MDSVDWPNRTVAPDGGEDSVTGYWRLHPRMMRIWQALVRNSPEEEEGK